MFLEIRLCRDLVTKPVFSPQTEWQKILESLARLYIRGVNVDWSALNKNYISNRTYATALCIVSIS